MGINGFQGRDKGDVVLNERPWYRCGKAEVELTSLGAADLQA